MAHLAVYTRISQDKTGANMSVDNQFASITEWAAKNGHTLGTHYSDNDISAYSGKKRPDFLRLLESGTKAVVCWHQDRLLRVSKDLELVLDTGMTVYQVVAGTLDLSTPQGKAVARTAAAWSTYEIEQKGARQKLRSSSDAKAGKWHYARPVFGNDRVTGALIPEEAKVIRVAADALVAGETTFFQISKTWNAAGFRTPKSANAGGRNWEPGTVRNFFTAPRLIGKRVYEGVTYEMLGWEPLLTEEVWLAVQAHIEAHKTGRKGVQGARHNPHLLTGIATCGHIDPVKGVCGNGLNIQYRGGKGSAKAYRCTAPGHVSRVGLPLEKFVVETFLYLLLHQGAEDVVNPAGAGSGAALRVRRLDLVKKYNEWIKQALELELDALTMKQKEISHATKLAEIDAQLLRLTQDTSFAGVFPLFVDAGISAAWDRWALIPVAKQRGIVQSLFKSIVVLPSPQGGRFNPKYVRLTATPLMLKLVDLNDGPVYEVPEEFAKELLSKATQL